MFKATKEAIKRRNQNLFTTLLFTIYPLTLPLYGPTIIPQDCIEL